MAKRKLQRRVRTPHDLAPSLRIYELVDNYHGAWFAWWTDGRRFTPLLENPDAVRDWIKINLPEATEHPDSLKWK